MSRKVVVLLHPHREDARAAALGVCQTLHADGITPVLLESEYEAMVSYTGIPDVPITVVPADDISEISTNAELVMVLGGDGTILRAAERFHGSVVPIMGVNLGHVGFLAESERDDLAHAVHKVSSCDYEVERRMALDVTVTLGNQVIHRAWALNEVTLEKSEHMSMLELVLGVDNRPVSSFGCDGVILATPTGSTAYAFSAGGPIVWPDVEALLMVPISAHALFTKPLVVSPDSHLGVEYLPMPNATPAILWCDGRREFEVPPGARIEARRSETPVMLARLNHGPFTDRLVAKFHLPVTGWRGPTKDGT